ncbi:MAG: hypothetical protein WB820_01715 [Rhodoplanes sp.]
MLKRCFGQAFGRHWPAGNRRFNFKFNNVSHKEKGVADENVRHALDGRPSTGGGGMAAGQWRNGLFSDWFPLAAKIF